MRNDMVAPKVMKSHIKPRAKPMKSHEKPCKTHGGPKSRVLAVAAICWAPIALGEHLRAERGRLNRL